MTAPTRNGWRDVAGAMGLAVTKQIDNAVNGGVRKRAAHSRTTRPKAVVHMVGQDQARTMLTVRVRGSRLRGEHPGNILLSGPPGLGKTTLAQIVAHETGGNLVETVGSQLDSAEVVARTFGELSRDRLGIVFIDEIHALTRKIEEMIYGAMEDGILHVRQGRGADAHVRTIKLPPFILIGATTRPGDLSQPLRDRFDVKLSLVYYTDAELAEIITRYAAGKSATIEPEAAALLGQRSRGTPRVALNLFRLAWDFALAMANDKDAPITVATAEDALRLEDIDSLGLTKDDRAVMLVLCKAYRGGPIGAENLAAATGVDSRTLDSAIEPWLIRAGLLRRTRRGRVATKRAFEHFELPCPVTIDDESAYADAAWEDR